MESLPTPTSITERTTIANKIIKGLKKDSLWQILSLCFLITLVLFLALYNLTLYPLTWFDEGVHLLVAEHLAQTGNYRFGPAIGPTVFYPVAMAFKLGGVSLLNARLAMIVYLLLCLGVFYGLVRYLSGWKTATIALLLFIASPGSNVLRWGRQVIGEVPALFFLLLGFWIWLWSLNESGRGRRLIKMTTAGILLGLAIITKNQFLLLLPALFLLWVLNWLYYKQAKQSDFIFLTGSLVAAVGLWYIGQRFLFPAGEQLAQNNVKEWSGAINRGLFTFYPKRILDAVKFLSGQDTFYAWVLPGFVYAFFIALRRNKTGFTSAVLLIPALGWLVWFSLFSVGWPRYAFLPLAATAIFLAQFFNLATNGFSLPLKKIYRAWQANEWDNSLLVHLVLLVLLAIIILRPLQGRITEVTSGGGDFPQQMAAYIQNNLPATAEIETYEPEICFLSAYKCHLPPGKVMDISISYVWYNTPPPSEYYDFRANNAPYLLIGDFGRWVRLYDPAIVNEDFELVTSIGAYELYKLKE